MLKVDSLNEIFCSKSFLGASYFKGCYKKVKKTGDINSLGIIAEGGVGVFRRRINTSWSSHPSLLYSYTCLKYIPSVSEYSKNTQTSAQFRDRGNDSFKKNSIEDALLNYNLAIMFAPANSEELGLAYANRAAVLMKLEDFQGSLADVDLAVRNNYPSGSIQKLKERRSKCERMLKKKEAENDPEEKNEVQSDRANRRKFCEGILFKVKKPNPSMPAAEDFVHVKYDEVKGRHLVVTRDIPAGMHSCIWL